ncbi:MAG: VWA domain-containing protein [Clostridium sp.]|nr:VWA domain-containing protein [Clostridium sp.]
MFSFAHPEYLYLLLVIPLLAGLFFLGRIARKKKLQRFGRMVSEQELMPLSSKYLPAVKLTVELIAIAAVIVAVARPRMAATETSGEETETVRGMEIMLCVDVSNSMLASSTSDPEGVSRMARAKLLIEKFLNSMQNDKVGLIVFAGEAYTQVPITSDIVSAKMFVNSLSPGMVATQGTAIGAALEMAANSFTPDSPFDKAIVLVTDAENFEDNAIEAARHIAGNGIQIEVIGLGTEHGVPIPVRRQNGEKGLMTDAEGNIVKTALNEKEAREIAKVGKGIYVNGADSDAAVQLDRQLDTMSKTEYQRVSFSPEAEQFPVFVWIALIMMVVNVFLPYRKIIWLTRYTFFKK